MDAYLKTFSKKNFTYLFFLGLAVIGMEWVSKVEVGLLGLLIIAQIDFVIGSFLPPTDRQMANGYIGYNNEVFKENLWSDYQVHEDSGEEYSFFKVFAVFFPAVTGIVAGANFSGDLKVHMRYLLF